MRIIWGNLQLLIQIGRVIMMMKAKQVRRYRAVLHLPHSYPTATLQAVLHLLFKQSHRYPTVYLCSLPHFFHPRIPHHPHIPLLYHPSFQASLESLESIDDDDDDELACPIPPSLLHHLLTHTTLSHTITRSPVSPLLGIPRVIRINRRR